MSRYMLLIGWFMWPHIAYRLYRRNEGAREEFLGTYAPMHLVVLLFAWVFLLLMGWGLFFYGIRDQLHPSNLTFASTVYYAGSSLLTIGYGDITAHTTLARMMSLLTGACGLAVVAVVISFLFAMFGSFQARERFVVMIGARAGVPPSGIGLLEVHAYAGIRSDLPQVFRDGQDWTAAVMESHFAYPALIMFRSSHDYESWVGTLGALMDAASLVISTLEPTQENRQVQGQARIMYDVGRHLVSDFSSSFHVSPRLLARMRPVVGIERFEFDQACEQLRRAGYTLHDGDASWIEFSRLRAAYGPHLNALARWLEIPPVQWIGDRSLVERQEAHVG